MIAIDTNLLIFAHRRDSGLFEKASSVLRELVEGEKTWAIPWPCIHEFFSIVTHPKVFKPASTIEQAIHQIEIWMESPRLHLLGEETDYWPYLKSIVQEGKIIGPKVHDAKIAAICIQNNVKTLWSADRDFSRMKGLQVKNPLLS